MKVIFMGTPEFAVDTLDRIYADGHDIVAVVTVPDKPSGRGLKPMSSPVKIRAIEIGLPVLQPEKLRDAAFVHHISTLDADVAVVVAFRMLPEAVWRIPKLGTLNLHASLLPNYRGAAPINHAIIQGEIETGVTTFFIDKEIDTGNLLMQKKVAIHNDWDAGTLHDVLKEVGADLVSQTLSELAVGNIVPIPQEELDFIKKAPKIFKEICKIDWNRPAEEIRNFIRGLSPYPAAFTVVNGKTLKIFQTEIGEAIPCPSIPGKIHLSHQSKTIKVETTDKFLIINELQPQGKKRMLVLDFLNGLHETLEKFES